MKRPSLAAIAPAGLAGWLGLALLPTGALAWGPETNVSATPTDSETGLGHRALAWDDSGVLHAVWAERDSPRSQYRIWTRRLAGTWGAPELVVDYLATDPGDAGDDLGAKYPALVLAPGGELHLFWHDYRVAGIENAEIFWKSKAPGAAWDASQSADVRLTTTDHPEALGDNGLVPVPVVTATGDLHVAWYDYRWDGQRAEICTKARAAGGSWDLTPGDAADVRITEDVAHSELVDLAVGTGGELFAVWRSADGGAEVRFAARDPSTSAWSTPAVVSTQATVAGAPALAVDAAGNAHVVWPDSRNGGRALFTRVRSPGGSWSAESRLTRPADGADEPSAAADVDGTLHLVWSDGRVSLLNREVFHRRLANGAAWDTTYAADTRISNAAGGSGRPSVAVRDGAVAVLWKDSRTGQNDVWARIDRPTGTAVPPVAPAPAAAALRVSPNPARGGPVRLELAPAARAAGSERGLLQIRDVAGRLVAELDLGPGGATWGLRDLTGRPVAAGVYFAGAPGLGVRRITVLR